MWFWVLLLILIILIYRYGSSIADIIRGCNASNVPMVKESNIAGWGVFASKAYDEGEPIDQCSTIPVPTSQVIGQNRLQDYVFQSHKNPDTEVLVPLGNCGLFNHANDNNASYTVTGNDRINVKANRAILKGEEITVNYGPQYWSSRNLTPA